MAALAQGRTVPVRMIDGLPVVSVTLGTVTADFLLDTGAAMAITVPKPFITPSAGVTEQADTIRTTDAGGVVHEVHRLRAESVALGAAALGALDGLVHYRWGLKIGEGAAPAITQQGTIGLHAFDKQAVLFELGQGRLTVFAASERPEFDASWSSTPFAYDKRGAVVHFTANGKAAELVLDSAATTSLMKKGAPVLTGANDVCLGQKPDVPACGPTRFSQSVIGNAAPATASFVVVAMGPLPFDGLLGIDFFKAHAIYLDFVSHEMRFKRIP